MNAIAWVLRRLGRTGETIEYASRALAESPRDVSTTWNLATTYGELRRFDESHPLFEQAMAMRPNADVIFMFYFGNVLWSAGDTATEDCGSGNLCIANYCGVDCSGGRDCPSGFDCYGFEDEYGNESIAIHSIGVLALAWDHRAVDGAYAAAFMARVKEIIETRDWSTEIV